MAAPVPQKMNLDGLLSLYLHYTTASRVASVLDAGDREKVRAILEDRGLSVCDRAYKVGWVLAGTLHKVPEHRWSVVTSACLGMMRFIQRVDPLAKDKYDLGWTDRHLPGMSAPKTTWAATIEAIHASSRDPTLP